MSKTTAPVSDYDRHAQFRARALEGLRKTRVNGRTVMVSTLLAPAGSVPEQAHGKWWRGAQQRGLRPALVQSHGTPDGYTEYLCRCDACAEAYSTYRQGLREVNLAQRKSVRGVLVSKLLGTEGYPDHGVVTGTYWYGCGCKPCVAAKGRTDPRAEYRTHLAARSDDGVLVSTLLGTEGHPEHGTYTGADWYGCWCEDCRWAKNAQARLAYWLRRNWPRENPIKGAASALGRDVLAAWSADAETTHARVSQLLAEHEEWAGSDTLVDAADKLVDILGSPAEGKAA